MKIAICIPTFNQAKFLRLAIESALAQNGVTPEVWVSDDASTDDTSDVMEEFSEDSRVRYHRNELNQGIAANAGWVMQQPDTEYLVRLDSDDLLKPDYCQTLVALLQQHSNAAVAHCAIEEIDEIGERRRNRILSRKAGFEENDVALQNTRLGYKVAANICMFRQKAIQDSFIYREGMNFAEDWDLFARLADRGWGNVYCPIILGQYRVWSDTGGYRKGHKVAELSGIIRLFEETLEPAWKQRDGDPNELIHARQSFAINHLRALKDIPDGSEDYMKVLGLLCSLHGNSSVIQQSLSQMNSPLGVFLRKLSECRSIAKDVAKNVLFRVR